MASQILAAILSFFIPGLGQFYAGSFLRGLFIFILTLVIGAISFLTIIVFIISFIFWIWNIVDAYQLAGRKITITY